MNTKHYPTYSQSIGLLGIMFLMALISTLIIMPFFSFEDGAMPALVYMISLSLTIVAAFKIRNDWRLELRGFRLPIVLISILAIISMHIVIEPIRNLFPVPEFLNKMFDNLNEHVTLYFLMIVIVGPLLEEIIFRGIILNGFLKNYNPLNAVTFSAFLFALIHGNIAQGIGAFLIGLLFGWIYWKSVSIIPCIVLHIFNNALGFIAFLFLDSERHNSTLRELINNDIIYSTVYAGSFLIVVAILFVLKKYSSGTKEHFTA